MTTDAHEHDLIPDGEGWWMCREPTCSEEMEVEDLAAALSQRDELISRLRECLTWIRDADPESKEIMLDDFAYRRMVSNYKDAASKGLAALSEETKEQP